MHAAKSYGYLLNSKTHCGNLFATMARYDAHTPLRAFSFVAARNY